MDDVKIIGMKELYEALSTKIPRNMEGKILQKALAAGTALVLKDARINVLRGGKNFPMPRTWTLYRSLFHARSKFDNTPTFESRVVGPRRGKRAARKGNDAWYARLVEYGHRVGTRKTGKLIRASRAETRAGNQAWGALYVSGRLKGSLSTHPPVEGRPFMRPAWDANKDKALQAILQKMGELLKDAEKKARW